MYYSSLVAALFVVLSLPVCSTPVPSYDWTPSRHYSHHSHNTTLTNSVVPSPTPTDDCSDTTPFSPPPATTSTPDATPTLSSTPSSPAPTSSVAPTPDPVSPPIVSDASDGLLTGGIATYFYQNGNPGACGQVNPDSAMICAMDQDRFGTTGPASPLCGRKVKITNLNNGWTVSVTVVDDCPTCKNANSIDLSLGAFQALEPNLSVGEFPISWQFE